jgi:hypothetical protein
MRQTFKAQPSNEIEIQLGNSRTMVVKDIDGRQQVTFYEAGNPNWELRVTVPASRYQPLELATEELLAMVR